ncbi:MFS transporter [Microlunatus sp. Gsoil 973]|uniref:MFS transporter n=1 Tax=Microlunatus sp. Gsoil 973 TaxID=2672569 RepID=UPI001E3B5473|nr:MFS transporter [Microlunatus sp. Gsoil 973]
MTEIVSWGILYYAFAILAPSINSETGWSATWTTAAFSAALVVAALVGIPVGRMLDARGPLLVMTGGSVLAAGAVLVIAWSPNLIIFTGGWLLAGIAMASVLYQPAFAALTGWYGARRLHALTAVTLVAGLASTVFAPVTSALDHALSWRQVYVILAAALALITIPVHAVVLRRPWPGRRPVVSRTVESPGPPASGRQIVSDHEHSTAVLHSRAYAFLVAGMALSALAIYAALINLVPLLIGRGVTASAAAWLLGLGGVGQVAGRFLYQRLIVRWSVRVRTVIIYGLAAVSTFALALVNGPIGVLVAVIMVNGFARGIETLIQATAIPDRWGTAAYGRLSGMLAAPTTMASALAPWIGAWLATRVGGYPTMFAVLAGFAAVGVVFLSASIPRRSTTAA